MPQLPREAIRAGAYDFISKPYEISRRCERPWGEPWAEGGWPTRGARSLILERLRADSMALVGHSPAIIEVMKTMARVAASQATVLVLRRDRDRQGAGSAHGSPCSDRANRRFVTVNRSALAEGLLESELFGHVKGGFTGAANSRPGLFREADKGTLLLDEIGDISPGLQARLLRVLQEQEIVPVGSETPIKVDVRVIAATHRDLPEASAAGRFREDLYYRLDVVTLRLPPLRERRQDIPLLVDHFLRTLSLRHGRGPVAMDSEAQRRLLAYDWPGNIRELQNVLERAVLLAEQGVIGPEHLATNLRPSSSSLSEAEPSRSAVLRPLEDVEREHVIRVLAATGGNREESSRILGISRRTLTRMIQRWGLPPRRHQ